MKKNLFSKKVNNKNFNVQSEQSEPDHCNFWDKVFNVKTFGIMWGFLIGICIIAFFDIRVFASTGSNMTIPYNVAEMQSYNEMMLDKLSLALAQYRQGHNISDDVPLLVWTQDGFYNGNFWQYYIMREPTLMSGYNYQDSYDFSSNYLRFHSEYQIESIAIMNNGNVGGWSINLGLNANLCGTSQSVTTTEGSYLPRYPFYYNGEPIIDSVYNTEVLISRVSGAIAVQGHATEPNLTDNDIDNNTKPDIDDYLPTLPTQPTIDNSTLETLVESLIDWLKWAYNGLTGTIKGFLQYIGDTITYSAQKIIDNIKNGINNLYQNFKSLFEPLLNSFSELLTGISEKLDYISQPFDSSALSDAFEETAIYSDIDSISQLTEDSFGVWSNTAEPNSFAIPLHTEQIYIDGHAMTNTVQYIDFGVIDSVKTPIRAVMWCLVTFGLLYTIIDSIPNYIGGNDE